MEKCLLGEPDILGLRSANLTYTEVRPKPLSGLHIEQSTVTYLHMPHNVEVSSG